MNEHTQIVKENLKNISNRLEIAANQSGRTAKDITLLAVTKYVTLDQMRAVIEAGVKAVGENKVQDAKKKFYQVGPIVDWHMIGHLQTNKARQAAALFTMIQSIDSIKIADAIDKEAQRLDRCIDVLVEVNISQDENKFGISPELTWQLVEYVAQKEHLKIRGLMAMAPYVDDVELVRPFFRSLNELFMNIKSKQGYGRQWDTLSMGMSNDFEIAVEEGATLIRIGTSLFKK